MALKVNSFCPRRLRHSGQIADTHKVDDGTFQRTTQAERDAAVPRYPAHLIAAVVAAICLGVGFFYAFGADTQSFTASDGSTGTAACASVWTHWFHSDQYVNTSVPWQIRDASTGTDDPNVPIIVAADDVCRGNVGSRQTITFLLLIVGVGAAVVAVVYKRRASSLA